MISASVLGCFLKFVRFNLKFSIICMVIISETKIVSVNVVRPLYGTGMLPGCKSRGAYPVLGKYLVYKLELGYSF